MPSEKTTIAWRGNAGAAAPSCVDASFTPAMMLVQPPSVMLLIAVWAACALGVGIALLVTLLRFLREARAEPGAAIGLRVQA